MPVMFAQHFARNTLRSIFITSLPPAPTQPRVPEPALDVDAFLKVNATDKDAHIQITKRISEKKKKSSRAVHCTCFALRTGSKMLK